jgi:uncharacterized protein YfaQ (DUF2300 family)
MSFSREEKVVCISPGSSIGLEKNKVYTIFNTFKDAGKNDTVEVLETMPPEPYHGYLSWRFRKAQPEDLKNVKKNKKVTDDV